MIGTRSHFVNNSEAASIPAETGIHRHLEGSVDLRKGFKGSGEAGSKMPFCLTRETSFSQFWRLNTSFDLLVEATPTPRDAWLLSWLRWLSHRPVEKSDTVGETIWLAPSAPAQWFSYVWVPVAPLLARNRRKRKGFDSFLRIGWVRSRESQYPSGHEVLCLGRNQTLTDVVVDF